MSAILDLASRRAQMRSWLEAGLAAVEPRQLTRETIEPGPGETTIIAIGKAAAAMCWGCYDALGAVSGICVTGKPTELPPGVDLILGDHPVPGERSFEAGRRVLNLAAKVEGRCVALISGGGSSLCEYPRTGVDISYMSEVNRVLVESGAPIDEVNLVRRHLSAIKCGGLAEAAPGPVETYVISDVAGHGAEVVASGPTIPAPADPDRAEELMRRHGIEVDHRVRAVMRSVDPAVPRGPVTVLADGHTCGSAIAGSASADGVESRLKDGWIHGGLLTELAALFKSADSGLTVAVGEPTLKLSGSGRGGRNTHAALLAATLIAGSDDVFLGFATDGVDGRSEAAGAIVDGSTLSRGGPASVALDDFDSARYLAGTGDLIVTGPTGTNVSDVWALWRT